LRPLCGFSEPQFAGPGNVAHFLIRAAKPSHTVGTLCDKAGRFTRLCVAAKEGVR
jgi:hypothetical protein